MKLLPSNLYLSENTQEKRNLCNYPETEINFFLSTHEVVSVEKAVLKYADVQIPTGSQESSPCQSVSR